ncbi:hypothetical protein AN232_01355 [Citrobacter sp. CRE-46]|nr:hypothetical protein AN232_01355 [Citrobacter sp. CRE-46]
MKFFILFLHLLEEKFHAKDHEIEIFQERAKSTTSDKLNRGTVNTPIKHRNFIKINKVIAQNTAS